MTYARVSKKIGGEELTLETGRLAKQADGAVVATYGDSVVLVTAQSAQAREGIDFFPLTVEYRERMSSGGKFPGGFIKREGRPSNREILICRLTDRPIRPLFPEGYRQEVQIIGQLLSADPQHDPDVLNITAASAALSLSSIPFQGPVAAVRVGLIDDEFILNPTQDQRAQSELDLVVAGTEDAVMMVEAGAQEVEEEVFVEALEFAHDGIREILPLIEELVEKAGKPKVEFSPPEKDEELVARIEKTYRSRIQKALKTEGKLERYAALDDLKAEAIESETEGIEDEDERKAVEKAVKAAFSELLWTTERAMILSAGRRADGRKPDEIRAITAEAAVLPRTHGSAVFTRGETQALVTTVLGTGDDEQRVENVYEDYRKRFYLDYNFPPFSVGEVRPMRGVGRREIGHGALAERALLPVIPDAEKFSYTIRVVSDILESNGSSSMATVCGGTLSMMDAGVPIRAPVAGIAMGLITDGKKYRILSDIAGSEDHNGDMDFKVAGTRRGITALQMDIKVGGLTVEILREALEQARKGRLHILDCMLDALPRPRAEVSKYAPRLERVTIPVEKIGLLIGPGGRQIKSIQDTTGAEIEVDDAGVVLVSASDAEAVKKAVAMVRAVTAEVEVGQVFEGKVVSIKDFGAFLEIAPGQEGLCHVSELSDEFVEDVSKVVQLGDTMRVKVIFVDPTGRIKLSRKALLAEENGGGAGGDGSERSPRDSSRDRGRRSARDDRGESRGRGDRGRRGDGDRGERRGGRSGRDSTRGDRNERSGRSGGRGERESRHEDDGYEGSGGGDRGRRGGRGRDDSGDRRAEERGPSRQRGGGRGARSEDDADWAAPSDADRDGGRRARSSRGGESRGGDGGRGGRRGRDDRYADERDAPPRSRDDDDRRDRADEFERESSSESRSRRPRRSRRRG